jgi:hypothetical protein
MDRETVSKLVRDTLASYRYELPPAGNTVGVPWSPEKVAAYVDQLKGCLVEPYLERFELQETYPQCIATEREFAEYWVVAESSGYLEWFDAATGEFGLGQRTEGSSVPVSIGVRGDLVGVFCAL